MSEDKQVIDAGDQYRFVPDFTTVRLPKGIYYPSYNANGEFVLAESADGPDFQSEPEEHIPFGDPFDASNWDKVEGPISMNTNENGGSLDSDEETEDEEADGLRADEVEAEWTNDSYFPLEDYNKGLHEADKNIDKFLSSKEYYEENNINYRRSLLFFGVPGVGKSQYVSNKSFELVRKLDAVVIRMESHSQVEVFAEDGMREVADGIPNRMKVIVFEELSEMVEHDQIRQYAVNILDSSQLRENVLFLATTNEPERLPKNFVDRPGRLDFLHGIYTKDNDPEYIPKFYEHLVGEEYPVDDQEWTEMICKELTPAYVKGLFVTAKERNEGLKTTYQRIKKRRELVQNNFKQQETGFSIS